MSSEEFSQAMNGERQFRRLEGFDLTQYHYDTVLVDPPRAGLDPASVELVSRFNKIIYISCNPDTLASDASIIVNKGYYIDKYGIVDMFSQTKHIESMVLFKQNETK